MLQHNKIANLYNPSNQSYEESVESFVIRKNEFNRILRKIKDVDFNSLAQHFLIEGQRGTGKTSLLLRLKYELEHDNSLSNLIAVQFAEEQYSIFDLCRLWENTAEYLEELEGFENLSDELDSMNQDENYSQECFGILEKYLIKNEKRLVLLLDNFGDILDKLSDIEQKRLRDIFHTSTHIQLIASSSRALEHTYRHDKPFFEFFKIIKLEGLNKEETITLLEQLSKTANKNINEIIKTNSNRIEIIRRLTGGIPRTIVLLFEIFLDDSTNVFEDLEMILDRVTPLYKHRMDDLSTQQQAIMDTIALNWDGITSSKIVEGLNKRGFDTKKVSAQLKLLEKNDLVISKHIDKKNKLYMVKERFFNIWYLMRYGRKKNKTQVLWLVKFLQEWCDGDEITSKAKNHIKFAKENRLHSKGGLYMAEALASLVTDINMQHELLTETKKALIKFDTNIDKKMSNSDIEIFKKANLSYKNKLFNEALNYLKQMQIKTDAVYSNIGLLYMDEFKSCDNAIKYYNIAIKKGSTTAFNDIGRVYKELKDFDNAIKYYKLGIEKKDSNAMNNLGILYKVELKDFDNAIKYYEMAVEKENTDAMNNLAALYQTEFKDFDNAIKYYEMAIEKENSDAMNSLAWLYYKKNINKVDSMELIKKSISIQKNTYNLHTYATILLWNDEYVESIRSIRELIDSFDYSHFIDDMIDYFLLLLAKQQYHLAYNLFKDIESLKDEFKPIYYSLMKLLKDEFPKEYLKMGSEMEETVNEILVNVEKKRLSYIKT